MFAQVHHTLKPVGVGHQTDLNEHAFKRHRMQHARSAIFVNQRIDLLATGDLGSLCVGNHRDVGQAVQLANQNRVSAQNSVVFDQCDMPHHASQVDGCFHARIATTDDCHMLALEQWAVAVRAVGNALIFEFPLARYVDVFPARTG